MDLSELTIIQIREKLKNKDPLSQEQIEKISKIYTANDGKRVFLT